MNEMGKLILMVRTVFDDGDGYTLYRIAQSDYESAAYAVDRAKELYDDSEDQWLSIYDAVEQALSEAHITYEVVDYAVASIDMCE